MSRQSRTVVGDAGLERARAVVGNGMEDADADRAHVRESSDRFGRDRLADRHVRAYIGLGANVGDPERTLGEAVHALAAIPGARVRGVSRLYATAPVGLTDQPEFRNAVVALDVPAGPDPETGALAILSTLKDLERAFGRRRRRRWGPRELDLDLLVFGRSRIELERTAAARSMDAVSDPAKAAKLLQVPHPAAGDRLFVLAPLADLAPGLVPPGWHETVGTARRRQAVVEGPDAVRPVGTWDAGMGSWRRERARQPR